MQNKELTNAVSQLNEALRIMNGNYIKLQRKCEDSVGNMQIEQSELKDRMGKVERKRKSRSRKQVAIEKEE